METATLRKDRVLEAGSKCPALKPALEILCPEFFQEEKPKEEERRDGWYKDDDSPKYMCYFKNGKTQHGIDCNGEWFDAGTYDEELDHNDRPATPEEIQEALAKEADKKGFKEGVTINRDPLHDENKTGDCVLYSNSTEYFKEEDRFRMGRRTIYSKGKWATIVPEKKKMTQEEIEKELGYKIEIIR